ncbi:hypothetical protein FM038_024850 [Shewanella eurypsychrophilus]|uniref:ABC transporter permease n=1 Tax=Shewanella eurypsychrophilus TaxID=2593656 RepID=A0ABX6VBZ8_9GAMM|nr:MULTISPECIES: hypothetical protein [Shewanella]QFU25031.1 hypothetical protein FS418_26475 [Shewanella sp. YLB-09]QPG60207.1 hypothetical protein FM038_024850 [Shewanella eurypsychrophilus]
MKSANTDVAVGSDGVTGLTLLKRRLSGVTRFWFFDLGSASFMGVAVLALLMTLPSLAFNKPQIIPLLLGLTQVSVSAAVAWQLNRLAATEWSILIPEYRQNILFQSAFMLLASFAIGMMLSLIVGNEGAFVHLLLATGLGLLFVYMCQIKPGVYYLSILLYLCLLFMESIALYLSQVMIAILLAINLGLAWASWQKSSRSHWHPDARTVYLNALEMGGIWIPAAKSYRLICKLEAFLHPVNFFMGPLLAMLILVMPLITLGIAIFSQLLGVQIPALFLLVQFSCVACTMVHWSRIQRWRAVETLFMLPGFSGKQGMIDAFNRAQFKLLILFTLIMGLTAAVISLFNPAITLAIWSHFVLSSLFGCGFLLGAGSACKSALHLSTTMLIIIAHSAWVSSSLRIISEETSVWPWLAGDLALVTLSSVTLWWGSKKLWDGDLV